MLRLIVLGLVLMTVACSALPNSSNDHKRIVVENFFTTRVNHLNPQRNQRWTMRYFSVTEFYEAGGPVLIWLGGNAPIHEYMIDETSLLYDLARQMNGAIFAFESRFYGQNRPTEDVTVENLYLLSTFQIMGDLAEFVTYVRRDVIHDEDAAVLVSGAGYGGALATWFRVHYPHLAKVAWSSGGTHKAVMSFSELAEAWGQTLIKYGGQACYNEVFVAFHVMQYLIDMGLEEIVLDKFNLCSEIELQDNLQAQHFFRMMMKYVQDFTLENNNLTDFTNFCDGLMTPNSPTALDSFASWFNTVVAEDGDCVNVDLQSTTQDLKQSDWNSPSVQSGQRPWLYQKCAEFGWFPTTDSAYQPFGSRVQTELYTEMCREVFGDFFQPDSIAKAVQRFNHRFGELTPDARRAHFTSGAEDPWRWVGIRKNLSTRATADVIPGELSGAETRTISKDDSKVLQAAKRRILYLLEDYLVSPGGPNGPGPGGPGEPRGPVKGHTSA